MKRIIIGLILLGVSSYADIRIVNSEEIEHKTKDKMSIMYIKGETKAFSGIYRYYFKEGKGKGKLAYEAYYTNGLKNGTTKVFYNNGNIFTENNVTLCYMDGFFKQYYYEGGLEKELYYNNGALEVAMGFYQNGNKEYEAIYKNGKKDGIEIIYNFGGGVKERILWKDGEIIRRE